MCLPSVEVIDVVEICTHQNPRQCIQFAVDDAKRGTRFYLAYQVFRGLSRFLSCRINCAYQNATVKLFFLTRHVTIVETCVATGLVARFRVETHEVFQFDQTPP